MQIYLPKITSYKSLLNLILWLFPFGIISDPYISIRIISDLRLVFNIELFKFLVTGVVYTKEGDILVLVTLSSKDNG